MNRYHNKFSNRYRYSMASEAPSNSENTSFSVQTGNVALNTNVKAGFYAAVCSVVMNALKNSNPGLQAQDQTEAISAAQGGVLTVSFWPIKRLSQQCYDEIRTQLAQYGGTINVEEACTGGNELRVGIDMIKGVNVGMEKRALMDQSLKKRTRPSATKILIMTLLMALFFYLWFGVSFARKVQLLQDWIPSTSPFFKRMAEMLEKPLS